MTVALYFALGLLYLLFAGYGLTGLLLRNDPHRNIFILLNGFCLTLVAFSESFLLFHGAEPAFLTTIAIALVFNIAYLITLRLTRQSPQYRQPSSISARKARVARWIPFILALGIVVFVTWSFFLSGWHSYWGSANEDMFDALNGRDAYLKGFSGDVGRFLDPLTRYQYSSLAFWSLLSRSFGAMNVFYLQGQLVLFIQVLGVYYLCREGFRLGHKFSLLAAFVGTCGSFYISTFFTGHEGSMIFAAIIPFLLGLGMRALRRRVVPWQVVLTTGLWLFVILHTYVFPLGFSVVPFVLFALYTMLRSDAQSLHPKAIVKRILGSLTGRGSRAVKLVLFGVGVLVGAALLMGVADRFWFALEPVRIRATTVFRAWGISHYKEMLLIYWGFLPSSIPFGSIANPAKLEIPAIMISGYVGAAGLIFAVLFGIRSILRTPRSPSVYLAFFLASWLVTFLVMKFVVIDSYYLYKFYYTNYFFGAIILVVSFKAIFAVSRNGERGFSGRPMRFFAGILAAGFVGLNLLYITLYNIDVAARPYNQSTSKLTDISPIRNYVQAGVYFNLPKFDVQNLLRYLFRYNGFPLPDAVSHFFEYELEVIGVDDVVLRRPGDRALVSENETYRLYKLRSTDKLSFDTYYQGERYQDIYDNHPFRWVKDKVSLDIIDPSRGSHSMVFCVEPGPGLSYRPFWLYIYVNGTFHDSTFVQGVQALKLDLPALENRVNEVKIFAREKGRNFLPWEERYLNYRLSLIGTVDRQFLPQTLGILNSPHDVVSPRGWGILAKTLKSFEDSADVLLVGNNWSPIEFESSSPLRWAFNDGQLLVFNPGASSRVLTVTLELGPALAGQKPMMTFLLNGTPLDSLILEGRHTAKIALPLKLQKENVITLHVNRIGVPVGRDPRVLNFRLLRASLGDD